MTKPAWKPIRTCLGCRTRNSKDELVRIARTPDGRVVLDRTGRAGGRGAYLCPDPTCLAKALKKGALARALRTGVPAETAEALTAALAGETGHE